MTDKPVAVKLKRDKNVYEILVHHGTVEKWRDGKLGWGKVAFADAVFKNSAKGDRYTDADLKTEFGTANIEECMKVIAEKGELQLTSDDRRKKTEETRKQIVQYIHKYYINPKTKTPHPVVIIDNALKEQRYNVTEEPVEKQVQKIMKTMIEHLPMRKNEVTVMRGTFTIPNAFVGKAQGVLAKHTTILGQNYSSSSCNVDVEFNSGDFDAVQLAVLQATQNEATFDITAGNGCGNGSAGNTDKKKDFNKKKNNDFNKKKGKKVQVEAGDD